MNRNDCSLKTNRQRGAALLIFMLIAILASLSMMLNRLSLPSKVRASNATMQVLAQAKDALIGWSAAHSTTPGILPCPEDTDLIGTANEGRALSSCTNSLHVGRLPWRTLGLPDLRDDAGERLWYAMSPGFRNAPINSDTPAQLTIDGSANSAVAIIFSAGAPLSGQSRPPPTAAAPPDVKQYLDQLNSSGTGAFVTRGNTDLFNDRLIAVSQHDLFSVVEKRVGREVRLALLTYFCGENNVSDTGACKATGGNRFFPRPAAFNDLSCLNRADIPTGCGSGIANNAGRIPASPAIGWSTLSLLRGTTSSSSDWFQRNAWRELVYYAVADACIDGTTDCNGSGMLTVNRPPEAPDLNQRVVVIVAGSALATTVPAQNRASNVEKLDTGNYLEDENRSGLANTYTRLSTNPNTPFNDQVFVLP